MWSAGARACVLLEIFHRRRGRLCSMLLSLDPRELTASRDRSAQIRGRLVGFRRSGCRGWVIVVDHVLEFLAGLEIGDLFGRDLNAGAGLGVASHAGLALAGAEAAKAADLDLVARAQGAD